MSTASPPDHGAPAHKDIQAHERLIVALDVPTVEEAREVVQALGDTVHFYKVGLELLLAAGGYSVVDWLAGLHKKVMLDLKIFDIARTTAAAVGQLAGKGVTFVTVHGTDEILRAAVAAKGNVKVLAVTVLTSFDQRDIEALGFPQSTSIKDVVLSRARRALEVGCDGVVSSGLEAPEIRSALGNRLLVVVPAVRPGANREEAATPVSSATPGYRDDQKRIVGLEGAFENGADHIVIGRPVIKAADRRAAAAEIQQRIAGFFAAAPVSG